MQSRATYSGQMTKMCLVWSSTFRQTQTSRGSCLKCPRPMIRSRSESQSQPCVSYFSCPYHRNPQASDSSKLDSATCTALKSTCSLLTFIQEPSHDVVAPTEPRRAVEVALPEAVSRLPLTGDEVDPQAAARQYRGREHRGQAESQTSDRWIEVALWNSSRVRVWGMQCHTLLRGTPSPTQNLEALKR